VWRRLAIGVVTFGLVAGGTVAVEEPAVAKKKRPVQIAQAAFDRMTLSERVGQLLIAGLPVDKVQPQLKYLKQAPIGNVFLFHTSTAGVTAVSQLTTGLAAQTTHKRVHPYIGIDQEGGSVQHLKGKGFSTIPSALDQGTQRPKSLRAHAKMWGTQLAHAGINVDFAPVADTVPKKVGEKNDPIGQWHREFGYTPDVVAPHVAAVVRGFKAAGITATVKHFPGIGRATGNTDTAKNVTDPTHWNDPYLAPFKAGIKAGARFVMISSARYPRIDKHHPACFSGRVIGTMLRKNLGFTGIVVSDTLSAVAVSRWSVGHRATRFLQMGGTMLLDSHARDLVTMERAILKKMAGSKRFAAKVKAAVMLVLTEKAKAGLIS